MLGACTAGPPPAATSAQVPELAGRSAGAPQTCVPFRPNQTLRTARIDGHILLYGSGRTIWVNHVGRSCKFRSTDALVVNPTGSHLCRGEVVHSVDAVSGIPGPSCILGDFVPYVAEG